MDSPPNQEVVALEAELEQVIGQIASPLSAITKGSPGQQDLERRKKAIEDRLVQLRGENDKALGGDLVDEDLSDVAAASEPDR